MSDKPKCSETSIPTKGMRFHYHDCCNSGVVERDGKWWCAIHDPVKVKERRTKGYAAWEEKSKRRAEKWILESAAPALLAACQQMENALNVYPRNVVDINKAGEAISAAIRKARGESA